MKITGHQLKQLIREELESQLSEVEKPASGPAVWGHGTPISGKSTPRASGPDWGGNTPSSDQDYLGKSGRKSPPGVMSGMIGSATAAAKTGVSDMANAYSSLQRGEDFSIAIPSKMAQALSAWLSRMRGCVSMNEARERLLEFSPAHLIAGIGAGILALCIMAMMMGYNAEVDVGGEVAGQEGHAKVVLSAPKKTAV